MEQKPKLTAAEIAKLKQVKEAAVKNGKFVNKK